jgi:hypothetical protein
MQKRSVGIGCFVCIAISTFFLLTWWETVSQGPLKVLPWALYLGLPLLVLVMTVMPHAKNSTPGEAAWWGARIGFPCGLAAALLVYLHFAAFVPDRDRDFRKVSVCVNTGTYIDLDSIPTPRERLLREMILVAALNGMGLGAFLGAVVAICCGERKKALVEDASNDDASELWSAEEDEFNSKDNSCESIRESLPPTRRGGR